MLNEYEIFLKEYESYLNSIESVLIEGKLHDLQIKSVEMLHKLSDARSKTADFRQKVMELNAKKAEPWKIAIAELNIKKNDLKIQMLSISDVINKLKMRYVTESIGISFNEFLILNETLKKLDI